MEINWVDIKQNIKASSVGIGKTSNNILESFASIVGLFPAAYISYLHMTQHLQYDNEPALVIAGAVEMLGYMIVNAIVSAMERGRRGLVLLGLLAFVAYLVVILSLNFSLSAAAAISPIALVWAKIFASTDLSLLSVPATILAAIQSQLRAQDKKEASAKQDASTKYMLDLSEKERAEERANAHELNVLKLKLDAESAEKDKKRQERIEKASKTPEKEAVSVPNVVPVVPVAVPSFPKDYRKLSKDQKVILSQMTDKEISSAADVTVKCGQNWLKKLANEGF